LQATVACLHARSAHLPEPALNAAVTAS
jgi:hypothetical protein